MCIKARSEKSTLNFELDVVIAIIIMQSMCLTNARISNFERSCVLTLICALTNHCAPTFAAQFEFLWKSMETGAQRHLDKFSGD